MSAGKVKASKVKVYAPPAGTSGLDDHFHVFVFDVFNEKFLPGKPFDTVEKAAAFQRHEQERIYTVQEAEPHLFDFPFISSDPGLLERVERDAEYRARLVKELTSEARGRGKGR